jgi:serine/threonine-protein kinase
VASIVWKEKVMLVSGTRLGPYQIIAPLGRGGMGEVYRARDIRLDRDVAVKIVAEHLADDADRLSRFEREARAVAALTHPNILVLYDIGHEQGFPFVVTELLEGVTVRRRLGGAALPVSQALEIAAAVCDGLAAAHERGVIHRDIKPENLFVTSDGRVKILDFGLARLQIPPPSEPGTARCEPYRTDTGTVMGTVGYASPEQLRGLPVDARTDLFSLGCVLYELVAGRRPFEGKPVAETAAAILYEEPPLLSTLDSKIPSDLERVTHCCLAKAPEQRFASARDLAAALRLLLSGSGVPPTSSSPSRSRRKPTAQRREGIRSLAVLPLVNRSGNIDAEYVSDGIFERIINALSRLPGLRVMARDTAFRYKGRDMDARGIGQSLKVRAVLTGEFLQRGDRLIIKVELVDVKDGSQIWGEQYDRPLTGVLAVEKAISQEIAEQLRIRLTGDERRRLVGSGTENAEAYRSYLLGRYHWNKRTEESLRKSIKLFEEAIHLDPLYALAHSGVADVYLNLGGWGYLPFGEAYPRAKVAAIRALEIDQDLAEAHVSLAMVQKEYDWDWPAACKGYQRALELNPNYAVAYQWYGEHLAALGRHPEAIAAFKQAINLDPLSLIIHATLGRHGFYFARQYDQAITQLRKTLDMDDSFWVARLWLGLTYAMIGRIPEAVAELQAARSLDDNLEIIAILGYTYGRAGDMQDAQRVFGELQQLSRARYVSPMLGALIATGMGENDLAFGLLEESYAERAQMMSELKAEPAFDPLRADPRFGDLLRRIGLQAAEPGAITLSN